MSRPASLRGAGLLPFVLFGACVSGCFGSGDTQHPDLEAARELGLPAGARLHRVTLGGRGAEEHAVPTRIEATPGDGVEFRTVDHRVHTLRFFGDSLTEEARAFLASTGQLAPPPLVSRGSRFILRLHNAPLGRYPFVSEGHGGSASGVVQVGPLEADSVQTSSR